MDYHKMLLKRIMKLYNNQKSVHKIWSVTVPCVCRTVPCVCRKFVGKNVRGPVYYFEIKNAINQSSRVHLTHSEHSTY